LGGRKKKKRDSPLDEKSGADRARKKLEQDEDSEKQAGKKRREAKVGNEGGTVPATKSHGTNSDSGGKKPLRGGGSKGEGGGQKGRGRLLSLLLSDSWAVWPTRLKL